MQFKYSFNHSLYLFLSLSLCLLGLTAYAARAESSWQFELSQADNTNSNGNSDGVSQPPAVALPETIDPSAPPQPTDNSSGALQEQPQSNSQQSTSEMITPEMIQLKRWDVLSNFIATIPAIISTSTGLVAVLQARHLVGSEGEGNLGGRANRNLVIALGAIIILGMTLSLILLRWQRSNQTFIPLSQQQLDAILSARLEEISEAQNIQLTKTINQQIEPVRLDISTIKSELQITNTNDYGSRNGFEPPQSPQLDVNRLASDFFILARWGIGIGILAVFGLRILGFLLRLGNISAESFLEGRRNERTARLYREEQRQD